MEICEEKGFFHDDFAKFRASINATEFRSFSRLDTDEQRVRFVYELIDDAFRGEMWQIKRQMGVGKALSQALEQKELGNSAFQYEKWNEAVQCFNRACLLMPSENDLEKAIVLANRSAALFHLNKYDLALQDIELSIVLQYPKDMLYKLFERKARCYFGLKDFPAALEHYRETFTALHYSNLSKEKRDKWMDKTYKLIEDLELRIANVKKYLEPVKHGLTKKFTEIVDKSLYFDCTENEGRFARTRSNLRPNHTLLKQLPHASVVTSEYSSSHCDHCCVRAEVLFACPNCVDVIYCSEQCRLAALASYHRFECGFLQHARDSGANVVCMLALRIVTQKSEEYFVGLKDELSNLTNDIVDKLTTDDYRKIYNFVTHSEQRNPSDYLKWTLMAVFLNTILRSSGFYKSSDSDGFFGTMLLHNMQVVTYNSHEISELQRKKEHDAGTSACIGAGLYPTLVLFNHSCDPDITRYFVGNVVHVRTIKNIPAGSVVAENYGQLFSRSERRDRQKVLKIGYKFECGCRACQENWPTVYEMNPSAVRFKCTAEEGCSNGLVYTESCIQNLMKCEKCGGLTDINKCFESLKHTDMPNRYKEATKLYELGEHERALSKYAAIMSSLDAVLVPPYREHHLCQQGIRRCCLELGSKYTELK